MKPSAEPLSLHDAISPAKRLVEDCVIDWQLRRLKERGLHANEGRFASSDAVKAIIGKFIANG